MSSSSSGGAVDAIEAGGGGAVEAIEAGGGGGVVSPSTVGDWSATSPVGLAVFSVVPEPNWVAQADRNLLDAISLALFFSNGGMLGIETRFRW